MQSIVSFYLRLRNTLYRTVSFWPLRRRWLSKKATLFLSDAQAGTAAYNLNKAFEAFFSPAIYADHKKYFSEIESLRRKLENDDTVILREDFGAGLSTANYTSGKRTTVARLCKGSSMPAALARLLYFIIIYTKPQKCLEFGTCLGISGAYIAKALQLNANGSILTTIEGDKSSAEIAATAFSALQLNNTKIVAGRFREMLPGILDSTGEIHFALIDGHHNGPATINYYLQMKHKLGNNAIIVFDDIDWSGGMLDAWNKLKQLPELYICIDTGRTGICVYSKNLLPKKHLFLPI